MESLAVSSCPNRTFQLSKESMAMVSLCDLPCRILIDSPTALGRRLVSFFQQWCSSIFIPDAPLGLTTRSFGYCLSLLISGKLVSFCGFFVRQTEDKGVFRVATPATAWWSWHWRPIDRWLPILFPWLLLLCNSNNRQKFFLCYQMNACYVLKIYRLFWNNFQTFKNGASAGDTNSTALKTYKQNRKSGVVYMVMIWMCYA